MLQSKIAIQGSYDRGLAHLTKIIERSKKK